MLDSHGLTNFENLLSSDTFSTLRLRLSFTFSQKCNTQVLLSIIIHFIFLNPIFEKDIPQSCSCHNCFR